MSFSTKISVHNIVVFSKTLPDLLNKWSVSLSRGRVFTVEYHKTVKMNKLEPGFSTSAL